MEKNKERLQVIENIRKAVENKEFKVDDDDSDIPF